MSEDIKLQFGKRIKELRNQIGWSQEDLALQAGINKNYLCDIENGRRNPTLVIEKRIANAFHITLAKLFEGITNID